MTVELCTRVSSVDGRLIDTAIIAHIYFSFKSSVRCAIRLGRDQSSSSESRSAISTKSDVAPSTADSAVVAVPSVSSYDALTARARFRRQRRFAHGVRSVPVMDTDLTSSLTRVSLPCIASVQPFGSFRWLLLPQAVAKLMLSALIRLRLWMKTSRRHSFQRYFCWFQPPEQSPLTQLPVDSILDAGRAVSIMRPHYRVVSPAGAGS